MRLKTDKLRMTEMEYVVGMLDQIDAKLEELMNKREPRHIKRFVSRGRKHSNPTLKDTQVPGRY